MDAREIMTDQVLFQTIGPLGVITLNRPEALNALTLEMIQAMDPQLEIWAHDPAVRAILVQGAGVRAFCAGGDLRAIYDLGPDAAQRMAEDADRDFFRHEYRLNWRIHHYPKPYIALIDGVTMGGGVGLSMHGSHRVAGERTLFAMPECAIGLFPDVGGGWFLPRCPGELGTFLALTGHQLKGADTVYAGIATHFVLADRLPALVSDLSRADWSGDPNAVVDRVLRAHTTEPGEVSLIADAPAIDRCFAADTVEEVIARLETEDGGWAATALKVIDRNSPTSLKVSLRQLRLGRDMDYDSCVTMEYRLSQRSLAGPDLFEGIRAVLVDKDRNPAWQPSALSDVTAAMVDRYFEPMGDRDLILD